MKFECITEFNKDKDRLLKKFKTLDDDLDVLKKALSVEPRGRNPHIVRVSGLGNEIKSEIYKVKHFRCRALRGKGAKSGIRVIYAYLHSNEKIVFIEMYHKSKKSNFDKKRIFRYFSK